MGHFLSIYCSVGAFSVSAIGVDKHQILYFAGQGGPLLYTEVVLYGLTRRTVSENHDITKITCQCDSRNQRQPAVTARNSASQRWPAAARGQGFASGNPLDIPTKCQHLLPVGLKVTIGHILPLADCITLIIIRAGTVPGTQKQRLTRKEPAFMYEH